MALPPRADDLEWPAELLHESDAVQCEITRRWESDVARTAQTTRESLFYAPPRVNGGADAGVVAYAPTAAPGGCWPAGVPRAPIHGAKDMQGFYVAACAPTNANELRRRGPHASGDVAREVCSRSHQLFLNTTRVCTGTHSPHARWSCKSSRT